MQSLYYDASAITITEGNPETDLGLSGKLTDAPDYSFHAKVYDVGSEYGIDGGRISKLNLYHQDLPVAQYDRGEWDASPESLSPEHKQALGKIVKAFGNDAELPQQDIKHDWLKDTAREWTNDHMRQEQAQKERLEKDIQDKAARHNPMQFFQKPADLRAEHKPPEGKSLADKKARQSESLGRSHKR